MRQLKLFLFSMFQHETFPAVSERHFNALALACPFVSSCLHRSYAGVAKDPRAPTSTANVFALTLASAFVAWPDLWTCHSWCCYSIFVSYGTESSIIISSCFAMEYTPMSGSIPVFLMTVWYPLFRYTSAIIFQSSASSFSSDGKGPSVISIFNVIPAPYTVLRLGLLPCLW